MVKQLSIRKKRFFISIVLLICGVFALYPYLADRPQHRLRKSVAGLERSVASAILNDFTLSNSLAAKAKELAASNASYASLTAWAELLKKEADMLENELLAMPEHSSNLSESAANLYASLNARLTRVVLLAAESEK